MILATVGLERPFDRLVQALDAWAAANDEPVVAQIGRSTYVPSHAEWFRYAPFARLMALAIEARVIVAHAGVGSILLALEAGTPAIIVPRTPRHGEHIDDHQLRFCRSLRHKGSFVIIDDFSELDPVLNGSIAPPRFANSNQERLVAYLKKRLVEVSNSR